MRSLVLCKLRFNIKALCLVWPQRAFRFPPSSSILLVIRDIRNDATLYFLLHQKLRERKFRY